MDHNPLCSLFNHKEYNTLSPTMFNYVMHASGYNFTVVHLSGVKNCLSDYLSRHPLWSEEWALIQDPNGLVSTRTNYHFINILVDTQVEKLRTDVLMDPIFEAAKLDQVYKEAVSAKVQGLTKEQVLRLKSDNGARQLSQVWERLELMDDKPETLLVLDGTRLFIPKQARKRVMEVIHLAHQGQVKSYEAAKSRYFWPGMSSHITQLCESCPACQEYMVSQGKEPFLFHELGRNLNQSMVLENPSQ